MRWCYVRHAQRNKSWCHLMRNQGFELALLAKRTWPSKNRCECKVAIAGDGQVSSRWRWGCHHAHQNCYTTSCNVIVQHWLVRAAWAEWLTKGTHKAIINCLQHGTNIRWPRHHCDRDGGCGVCGADTILHCIVEQYSSIEVPTRWGANQTCQ